ncbi:MAG TPA: site-specific integrase [Paludibacter sp.]|nr:site-specific integrase [Paludibacter sp.]
MKLQEVFELFLKYKKPYIKLSSLSVYEQQIDKYLGPELAEIEDEIHEVRVQEFLLSLHNKGLSNRTIKASIVLLKTTLKWANKNKLFIANTDWTLEYPKSDNNNKISVYSDDQINRVLNFLIDNLSFKNIGVLTVFHTGMRIGELSGLRWGDVDVDLGIISINRNIQRVMLRDESDITKKSSKVLIQSPKSQCSKREIPLTPDLQIIYSRLKPFVSGDNYVLSNSKKPIEPRAIRPYFDAVTKYLNLPHLKFHGIRHSFATKLIRDKADVKTVSTLLGHSNVGITMNLYVHPDFEQKQKILNSSFKSLIS